MRVTLEGSLIAVVHNEWGESEWQGRRRPAGSETVAYVASGFHEKPERVILPPEFAQAYSDPGYGGCRLRFFCDLGRGRFGPELTALDVTPVDAEVTPFQIAE